MNITRENYEAYFLDYHEGNLADRQIAELMEFLAKNPALKEEFEAFEMVMLEEDSTPLPFDRNVLKKSISAGANSDIDETLLIAYHEGDLGDADKKRVLKAVAENPEIRKTFALYGSTHLEADTSLVFPAKQTLKRHALGGQTLVWRRMAVAAAFLAFMAALYFLLPRSQNVQQLAQKKEAPTLLQTDETSGIESTTEEMPVLTASLPVPQPEKSTPAVNEPSQVAVPRQLLHHHANQLAVITPKAQVQLATPKQPIQEIALKDDFYWFSYAGNMDVSEEEEMTTPQVTKNPRYSSLTDLAYSGIERSTGIDIKSVETSITNRNFGLWDIAGIGLAGISQITGTSLTIDKERDENGRITSLGIGDRFKISR